MKIQTTTVSQTANEILGVEAKNLYYLILETSKAEKLVINVGKKTHDNVEKMLLSEQTPVVETPKTETKVIKK